MGRAKATKKRTRLHHIPIEDFRKSSKNIIKFQKTNGKVGAHAMAPFLAKASLYTKRPFSKLEKLLLKSEEKDVSVKPNVKRKFKEGSYLISLKHSKKRGLMSMGKITFKNISKDGGVLMVEPISEDGKSKGFIYQELGPGDTFSFFNNQWNVKTAIYWAKNASYKIPLAGAAIFTFALVVQEGREFYAGLGTCGLFTKSVMPNSCTGTCPPGSAGCFPTGYQDYDWFGMMEPTACSC